MNNIQFKSIQDTDISKYDLLLKYSDMFRGQEDHSRSVIVEVSENPTFKDGIQYTEFVRENQDSAKYLKTGSAVSSFVPKINDGSDNVNTILKAIYTCIEQFNTEKRQFKIESFTVLIKKNTFNNKRHIAILNVNEKAENPRYTYGILFRTLKGMLLNSDSFKECPDSPGKDAFVLNNWFNDVVVHFPEYIVATHADYEQALAEISQEPPLADMIVIAKGSENSFETYQLDIVDW